MVPAGSVLAQNRTAFNDLISMSFKLSLWEADEAWKRMAITSSGVASNGIQWSRDMLINKVYITKVAAGTIKEAKPYGDFPLYGEGRFVNWSDRVARQGSPTQNYPNAFGGSAPRPFRMAIPMRAKLGNIGLTMDVARADVLDPVGIQLVESYFAGWTDNWAAEYCTAFYQNQNDSYKLCSLPASGSYTLTAATKSIQFEPTKDELARFMVGKDYDLFNSTTRVNETGGVRIGLKCTDVDWALNKVTLVADTDPSLGYDFATVFSTSTIGSSAIVVNADSYDATSGTFTNIAGINSFMKFANGTSPTDAQKYLLGAEAINDSTLGGAVDITVHTQFKSHYYDMAGQPLTEASMRTKLDAYERSKRGIMFNSMRADLDTWIGTRGQLRAWQETRQGQFRLDRTGSLDSMTSQGGGDELVFTHGSKKYRLIESEFVEYGTSYFLKMNGGNWKKFVPPTASGMKRGGKGVPAFVPVEFIAPWITGLNTNQLPYRSSNGQVTNGTEFPCDVRMQCAPEVPCGIKIVNAAESKVYPDATN